MSKSVISVAEIPLQSASMDTWAQKYQLHSKDGTAIDKTVDDSYKRVARALADVELTDKDKWYEQFLWALRAGATPAGRIMSNAGAMEHKPKTSTINCVISKTLEDSMAGILSGVYEAGITLAAGCGIGYDFSTLRPRGAFVAGVGAKTSGTLSFMEIYDKMCFTVASAGGRRGAQMGTLLVTHPAIKEFIQAKRQDGVLRQFNLSVLITEEFMTAVEFAEDIALWFPYNKRESEQGLQFVWKKWPYVADSMITNDEGLVKCKVYEKVNARELWDLIMKSNYDYAEPGFILIDKVNRENNLWFCEDIRTSNPCAEQIMPPYGACLLGSINLTKFVVKPFTPSAAFAFTAYAKCVKIFTRMLDNVVEINGLPLKEQRDEILRKRRHGMGFYGLGSALTMLGIRYGSKAAIEMASEIAKVLAVAGWEEGYLLGVEKGVAPIMREEFDGKTGAQLMCNSDYMRRLSNTARDTIGRIAKYGCRFSHHSSIAPTGTISLTYGNNASNGIEPTFAHRYTRNIIKEGQKTKEAIGVYSYEFLLYCSINGLDKDAPETLANLPDYFATTDDLTPQEHVEMQAAVQPWIDSAISKTVNVPSNISLEDFKGIYIDGWKRGLKGMSTFRFNPEAFTGVLVKESDLANTLYTFNLDDDTVVTMRGNEQVEYDGAVHSVSNLFDAIKEGTYGRM